MENNFRKRVVIKLPNNGIRWEFPNKDKNKNIKVVKVTKNYVYYEVPAFIKIIVYKGNTKVKYPAYTFRAYDYV
jgi:hypothetical protein